MQTGGVGDNLLQSARCQLSNGVKYSVTADTHTQHKIKIAMKYENMLKCYDGFLAVIFIIIIISVVKSSVGAASLNFLLFQDFIKERTAAWTCDAPDTGETEGLINLPNCCCWVNEMYLLHGVRQHLQWVCAVLCVSMFSVPWYAFPRQMAPAQQNPRLIRVRLLSATVL